MVKKIVLKRKNCKVMWTSLLGAKVINRNFQCNSRNFPFSIIEGFLLLAPSGNSTFFSDY